jgi:hypothetical protein
MANSMTTYSSQPDGTGGVDSHIRSNAATTNYGTDTTIIVGNANPNLRRALIKFDLTSIPSTSIIDSAVLSLYISSNGPDNSGNSNFSVYNIKRVWTETGVTWNKYDGTNDWQTAGGTGANDYDSTALATTTIDATPAAKTEFQFTLSISAITNLVNGTTTNNGWLIRSSEASFDRHTFYSSDEGTETSSRPKLVITYHAPSGFVPQVLFI